MILAEPDQGDSLFENRGKRATPLEKQVVSGSTGWNKPNLLFSSSNEWESGLKPKLKPKQKTNENPESENLNLKLKHNELLQKKQNRPAWQVEPPRLFQDLPRCSVERATRKTGCFRFYWLKYTQTNYFHLASLELQFDIHFKKTQNPDSSPWRGSASATSSPLTQSLQWPFRRSEGQDFQTGRIELGTRREWE